MKYLPIGDFCSTGSGGTPSRSKHAQYYDGGTIPWIKSGELANSSLGHANEYITEKGLAESSAKLLQPGAILLAMYGATVGQVSRLKISAATNQAICHLYPDPSHCDMDYLYRVLKGARDRLIESRVGGGQPNISQRTVRELQIPLPPLPEQKRIAQILDAADDLRAKRRDSIALLDTLVQSTFTEMFGDPVSNPMSWDTAVFEDLLDRIDSGWSPKCLARTATSEEWGVLKLGAVTSCKFDEKQQKALPENVDARAKIEVNSGDLLFTRKNTHDLVAAAALVHNVRPKLLMSDLIFRLVLKPDSGINTFFLWQLLIEPRQRKLIQSFAGGAAGSMPNISKAKLNKISLIKPPHDLQLRYATIVKSIEIQKSRLQVHLSELDTLFASLQSRAFNGEL